jgi:hypothetical protein
MPSSGGLKESGQPGDGLRFRAKASQVGGAGIFAGENHLEGDQAIELDVPRLVNHSHAAAAQLGEDFVLWNCR